MSRSYRDNRGAKSEESIGHRLRHQFGKQAGIVRARQIIAGLSIDCAVPIARMFSSKIPTFKVRASRPPSREPSADL